MTSQPSNPNPYQPDPYRPDQGGASSERPNPYAAQSHDSTYRPAEDRYRRPRENRRQWMWILGIVLTVVGYALFLFVFFSFSTGFGSGDMAGRFQVFPLAFVGVLLAGLGGWLRKYS